MKKLKRMFLARAAMTLVFAMLTTMTAWAQDVTIGTSAEWDTFAAAVSSGTTYNGQTVKLTADITVTTMAGTSANRFKGTFLGGGHTLTLNYTATANDCAPFLYIEGATIKMLKVAGTISTDYKYAAGFAAHSYGNCTIQNCWSNVAITSSYSGTANHAGFVAVHEENGSLNITNCLFDGSITGSNTSSCSGFVGKRNDGITFTNCLSNGTISLIYSNGSGTFLYGTATFNNCYYKKFYGQTDGSITSKTGEELRGQLGSGWEVSGDIVVPSMDVKHLGSGNVSGVKAAYLYTGSGISITPVVTNADGTTLTLGTDFTATLNGNNMAEGSNVDEFPFSVINEDSYTLTVTGTGTKGNGYYGELTVSFTVTSTPEGMSVDNDFAANVAGHYYVNMPKTGTNTLNIPDGFTSSFKVYDDGGKNGNYSSSCNSKLILIAPDGYVFRLSGTITARTADDLNAYDGYSNASPQLFNQQRSSSDGVETAIPSVTTTGTAMYLKFSQPTSGTCYSGLDLTVTLVSTSQDFDINGLDNVSGGSVAAEVNGSVATQAKVNEVVTLNITPESGYMLRDISIKDGDNNAVPVVWDGPFDYTATFTMPGPDVTVTPTFTNELTAANGMYINMPHKGTLDVTIPTGVQSFKVYDEGGKDGRYTSDCKGYLQLTAPAGYVLQLSGTINTGNTSDYLEAYNGLGNSAPGLLTTHRSTSNNTNTTIETVQTTGQNLTIYFYSYSSGVGLDLTVDLVKDNTQYDITVSDVQNGSVTSNPTEAAVNDVVTLTATPASGDYMLKDIIVTDASSNNITVAWDGPFFNTATFSMPGSAVTVSPTFTNDLTAAGGLYVNMPSNNGSRTVNIPAGVQSFKVYDDGGATGPYSVNASYLTLTAPDGYLLQLTGNITIENSNVHYLTVYNGKNDSGTVLLNEAGSSSTGVETAIPPVTTTGTSMTLYFRAGNRNTPYAGLDLTVTLVSNSTTSKIILPDVEGGSVAAQVNSVGVTQATVNDVVTLTATPASDYMLTGISVTDENSSPVVVTWDGPFYNTASFTMPGTDVTVTPTFTNDLTAASGLYINMPATDTKTLDIPAGVQSFKVYDDGGSAGFYSYNCNGKLVLTAPEGYVLQLTGEITTDNNYNGDYLQVFDGTEDEGNKRLLEKRSDNGYHTTAGVPTSIGTVTSSSQSMLLKFISDGWGNSNGLDLTVTVVPITYTVSFNATSGSGDQMTAQNFTYNVAQELNANSYTAPMGYTFAGWSTTYNGDKVYDNQQSVSNLTTTQNEEVKLYAKWIPVTYTVSFNKNGGSGDAMTSQNFTYGQSQNLTANSYTLAGYEFIGWATTADGDAVYKDKQSVYDLTTTQGADIELFAKWEANKYFVRFNANGGYGDEMSLQTFTYDVQQALTANSYTRSGYVFAGWATSADGEKVYDDEQLMFNLTTEGIVDLYAVWTKNELTLLNDDSEAAEKNATIISSHANDGKAYEVTLSGRTLTKDGNWNTLCLPFSLTNIQIAAGPLAGATIKELDNAADATSLSNEGVLTLKFKTVYAIEAGKPCIVKWTTTGDNISDPVFEGVTITSTTPTAVKSDDGNVTFAGQYSPFTIDDTNINSVIMLGANNTLGYSQNNRTLRTFRAHFEVSETANVREFVLDFGDDVATGIVSIHNSQSTMHNDAWYTIDGRKLGSKPTAKGVYVNNGKKIVIK